MPVFLNTVPGQEGSDLSILIKGGLVVTQNWKREVLKGDVLVDGDKIAAVGHVKTRPDEVVDASGCLVMPGLINCHTHVAMAVMRSAADDVKLEEFLDRTFAIDSKRGDEDIAAGTRLGCLEMIHSGTTAFLDMYYSEDVIAKCVEEMGLRGFLGWAVLDEKYTTQRGSPVRNCESFIKAHKGRPLIRPWVGVQGVYVCSDETLMAAKEVASRNGTFCHYHLSETRPEVYEFKKRKGKRPVEHLSQLGFFTKGDVAAHGVWLTINEVRLLSRAGVAVAHCPTSNMKLASGGVAPVPEMLAEGVQVCLGTDSCSSNNSLDMFGEMKVASLVHKAHKWDARVIPAQKALDMATVDAAKCLGAGNWLGSLEPGKKADIVILDCARACMLPISPATAVTNIVYCSTAQSVRDTIIDGRFVLRNGKAVGVDEPKILLRAQESWQKLLEHAK
jgi:5-methylthioadenosine/S-adenosylhomocysteine deaminase